MQLAVILSDASVKAPAGVARFGVQLTKALIENSPDDWSVSGYSHRLSADRRSALQAEISGLTSVRESVLPRSALGRAWESAAAAIPPGDTIFAPSLFAPLAAGKRARAKRLLATIHDLVPFTHPETLSPHGVRWHRRQIRRAQRWADAVIVPSEAVADALNHFAPVGDRVHVVSGAATFELPHRDVDPFIGVSGDPYVLFIGTLEPRKGLDLLITAMAHPLLQRESAPHMHLVIAGAQGWGGVDLERYARTAGLDPTRLHAMGRVPDSVLAQLLRAASALVVPSRAEGFGLTVVEAMAIGTPVIHSLDPALTETAGGAGIGVDLTGDPRLAAERLATAIESLANETGLAARLSDLGLRRSAQFSWRKSAQQVWQLARG